VQSVLPLPMFDLLATVSRGTQSFVLG
jgi:hypothetical protein